MYRKCTAVLLTIAILCLALPVNAYANESYDYGIVEEVNENKQIVRFWEKPSTNTSAYGLDSRNENTISDTDVRNMIANMGMIESEVELLSSEELDLYRDAQAMWSTSTYYQVNEETGIIMTLSEEEMSQELLLANAERAGQMVENDNTKYNVYLYHSATLLDNGYYNFVTEAKFLTMPFWRGTDTMGSCAMEIANTLVQESGRITVTKTVLSNGQTTVTTPQTQLTSDDIDLKILGDYTGAGVIVNLPEDVSVNVGGTPYMETYTDYTVHLEFVGGVRHPTLVTRFNSYATYSHSTVAITVSPSLRLVYKNTDLGATPTFVISSLAQENVTPVDLFVEYIP